MEKRERDALRAAATTDQTRQSKTGVERWKKRGKLEFDVRENKENGSCSFATPIPPSSSTQPAPLELW
jgi:hypothetical protein